MGSLPVFETPTYPFQMSGRNLRGPLLQAGGELVRLKRGSKSFAVLLKQPKPGKGAVLRGFRVPCLECALEALIPLSGWQWPPGCSDFVTCAKPFAMDMVEELQSPPSSRWDSWLSEPLHLPLQTSSALFLFGARFPFQIDQKTATHFFRHPAT